jgi:hypothetical protein
MARHFYYLIASLPPLAPDSIPFSSQAFLSRCKRFCNAEEMAVLADADLDSVEPCAHRGLAQWRAFERELRNQLAVLRSSQLALDVEPHLRKRQWPPAVSGWLREAFERGDPLLLERRLLDRRWRFVQGMERRHYMSFNSVLAHYLHLQLAERWAAMNAAAGMQELTRLREQLAAVAL